jgi:hypothetical protein
LKSIEAYKIPDFLLFAGNLMESMDKKSVFLNDDIYRDFFIRGGCDSEKAIFSIGCELGRGKGDSHCTPFN